MVGEGFPARCKVGVVVSHTEDIFGFLMQFVTKTI